MLKLTFDKVSNFVSRLSTADIAFGTIIAVLAFFASTLFAQAMSNGFWRHDNLSYISSYNWNFRTEGRWFIYYAFPLLSKADNYTLWVLDFFVSFIVLQALAFRVFQDRVLSVIFGLSGLMSVTLMAQLNWPAVTLPGLLALLAGLYVVDRVPRPVFFIGMGIFLHGAFPQNIYLLPLFVLGDILRAERERQLWQSIEVFAWWSTSFVIGHIVAQLLTFLHFGRFIELAAWRRPTPATDLESFLNNASRSLASFKLYLRMVYSDGAWAIPIAAVLLLIVALWNSNGGARRNFFIVFIFGVAMMIAHFVIVLPSGIVIQTRTLHPFFIANLLLWFSMYMLWRSWLMPTVALVFFVVPSFINAHKEMSYFSYVSSAIREVIDRELTSPGYLFRSVVVDGRNWKNFFQQIHSTAPKRGKGFESLSEVWRGASAFRELGFRRIIICDRGSRDRFCLDNSHVLDFGSCQNKTSLLCAIAVTEGGDLLVRPRGWVVSVQKKGR
ncbi:MAG: hypothetical protein ACU843_09445 [Gammaproteobacteria bacterium]